jgi:S-(hydroxymethyl)glutathione dehydrogenase/alcohol dehydrogenase
VLTRLEGAVCPGGLARVRLRRRRRGGATAHTDGDRARRRETVFSGKRIAGSVVGGAQILRLPAVHPARESGRLDLGSMVSHRIKLDEINDGIDLATRGEGVRTVIV